MATSTAVLNLRIDINDAQAVAEARRTARLVQQQFGNVDVRINSQSLRRSSRQFGKFNKVVQTGAIALTGYASVAFIAAEAIRALAAAAVEAVKTFAAFDRTITTIGVVSGATAKELEVIRTEAERLGRTTEFTASQVAELQLVLARGGFSANEITALSEAVLDLATVSGEDAASAAGTLTSVIRTFRLEASDATEVLDVLTTGFNSSRLQLEFFTTAFGFVGSVAAEAGLELRDLTAILGFLADRGIRASTAGTAVRQALIDLRNPSSKAAQALGFTINNAEGLFIALKTLNEQGIASSDVFRKTAVPAINVLREELANGNLSLKEFRELLENVDGASEDAADAIRDTLSGDIANLQSAFEALGLAITEGFETPLRQAFQFLTAAVREAAQEVNRQSTQIGRTIDKLEGEEGLSTFFLGPLRDLLPDVFFGGSIDSGVGFGPGELIGERAEQFLKAFEDVGIPGTTRDIENLNAALEATFDRYEDFSKALKEGRDFTDIFEGLLGVTGGTDGIRILDTLNNKLIPAFIELDTNQDKFNSLLEGFATTQGLNFETVRINFNRFYEDFLKYVEEVEKLEEEGPPITNIPDEGDDGRRRRGRGGRRRVRFRLPTLPSSVDISGVIEAERELSELQRERVTLQQELLRTDPNDEQAVALAERSLEINDAATKLVENRLRIARAEVKAQERQNEIRQVTAELIALTNIAAAKGTTFTAEETAELLRQIQIRKNRLNELSQEVELSEAQLERAEALSEELGVQLEIAKQIVFEQDKIKESAERIVDTFGLLDQNVLGGVINSIRDLGDLLALEGEEAATFGEKLGAGLQIGNQALQEGLNFALQASRARAQAIDQEFQQRIAAAEGFTQVQEKLEEERTEKLRQEQQKQARLQKAAAIFSIIISGAQAIASTLGQTGFLGAATIPVLSGLIAAQIAVVAAQPIPQFAEGGLLGKGDGPAPGVVSGPSHAKGGVKGFFAGRGFEVEGGEALDYDEHGNLVVINKRSTAAFSRQLRAMRGRSFAGKSGILSKINAKYGNPFDKTTRFFQDGGVMRELSQVDGSFAMDNTTIVKAIYEGSFNGTSEGIQVIDTNRRRERQRVSRSRGELRPATRNIFGLDQTGGTPVRSGRTDTHNTSPI